jgi:hypothetical protein
MLLRQDIQECPCEAAYRRIDCVLIGSPRPLLRLAATVSIPDSALRGRFPALTKMPEEPVPETENPIERARSQSRRVLLKPTRSGVLNFYLVQFRTHPDSPSDHIGSHIV